MSSTIPSDIATRLNYRDGMFLTSAYMGLEQNYFSNWFRLQNRYLYNAGVLDGLQVTAQDGNTLTVSAGAAIDDEGDFLIFPGQSGNRLTLDQGTPQPFAVFAVYPTQTPGGSADTVDQAATLAIAAPNRKPPRSVLLAQGSVDDNGKLALEDKRTPVTSRLPADLAGDRAANPRPSDAPGGALRGEASVPTTDLAQPGQNKSVEVFFADNHTPAFDEPPRVYVSTSGAVPFATLLSAIDTRKFSVTISAVQASDGTTPLRLNWLATANGEAVPR